jgi:hypothetical protein
MKKKILVILITLIVAGALCTPAMAIGPINSEHNPNTVFPSPIQVQLTTPSGIFNEWIQTSPFGVPVHVQRKDAANFQIGNAADGSELTFPDDLIAYENEWIFLTQQEYYDLLISIGVPPGYAQVVVMPFTEGVYWKISYVG